ncbi:MAG: lysophospholipase [Hyphomonadaceae bacterium]|nr:lysophospholipase [Hyphomonadaceae bacterium]
MVRHSMHGTGQPDTLSFDRLAGAGPGVVWLGGFRSDRTGTKAEALMGWAARQGRAALRFDYSGHGASPGRFEDGSIGRWREEALAMLDAHTTGPQVLVGSSMGGWIALLCAIARPERIAGLVLIAPAPDFTERLMWPALPEAARFAIQRDGVWRQPSAYAEEPTPLSRTLFEQSRRWLLLDAPSVPISAPVRILHGQEDPDVPWRLSLELAEKLETRDVAVSLIKDGDHRLSREGDIARMLHAVAELAQ